MQNIENPTQITPEPEPKPEGTAPAVEYPASETASADRRRDELQKAFAELKDKGQAYAKELWQDASKLLSETFSFAGERMTELRKSAWEAVEDARRKVSKKKSDEITAA